MSLFKRVQNILEEDRKAYFSSKQTDLYEKIIQKKFRQEVSKRGGNILTKIAKTPFGRYIKKKYGKLRDKIYLKGIYKKEKRDKLGKQIRDIESDPQSKEIRKQIEKETGQSTREYTQKSGVTKGNENKKNDFIDDFIKADDPFDVKNTTKKTYTPKKETIIRPNIKNKKYRNKDGSFNQELYDKDKASYKSFIETPKKVDPKIENPKKVDPQIETPKKVDPPKTNPFKDFLKKIEPGKLTRTAIKTAGGVGAVGIVANKVLDNSKTEAELENIKKQNKKLITTSNGNNKMIPNDPNNKDATTTTKKLYPVKLKFGLGSDR